MAEFSFNEDNGNDLASRFNAERGAGALGRLVMKVSRGRVRTVATANLILFLFAIFIFLLAGLILYGA